MTQAAWAMVFSTNGYIDRSSIRFHRKDVIKDIVATYRGFRRYQQPAWANLTDTKFWRKLKHERGFAVRRIEMTVI